MTNGGNMQQDNSERKNTVAESDESMNGSHHKTGSTHSSHSHHSTHHSSHNKKHKKRNLKTVLKSALKFWDKKYSKKKTILICAIAIAVQILLIGLMHMIDAKQDATLEDIPNSATLGAQIQLEETGNTAASVQTITIPAYWKQTIEEKTEEVKALQAVGGKDCVSFVWASDPHIPDNHTAKTTDIGKLMAQMMDNCNMPFALITGDIGTRASFETEAELKETQEMIPIHLAPLWGTDRLLMILGNHDGCYGDASCYYKKQFSSEQIWELYFRNQALDFRRTFSEDGTYYYVDDHTQKIRFILLNSQFGGEYAVDEHGVAVNDRFGISCYGQEQLDWFANVALDMPDGYGAVIASHVPPNTTYTVDRAQLIGIINAYCNRTVYTGSYTEGVDGWTNSHIDVDFTDAQGEIIVMLAGHVHDDGVDTETLNCPLITIISAGAPVNTGEAPERIFDTDTETSFDVVTINRKTRTIYCTRIGAGEDRVIPY